mmetsp:Transcript_5391/g.11704  ORF Transcript_5391/g.11704 Transcript_5391/m.11704 type:complete len:222 (+) Transcript_5391:1122-1787(+)
MRIGQRLQLFLREFHAAFHLGHFFHHLCLLRVYHRSCLLLHSHEFLLGLAQFLLQLLVLCTELIEFLLLHLGHFRGCGGFERLHLLTGALQFERVSFPFPLQFHFFRCQRLLQLLFVRGAFVVSQLFCLLHISVGVCIDFLQSLLVIRFNHTQCPFQRRHILRTLFQLGGQIVNLFCEQCGSANNRILFGNQRRLLFVHHHERLGHDFIACHGFLFTTGLI